MLREKLAELKSEARRAGVPWSWVVDQKNELVRLEAEKRAHLVEARQAAWYSYVGRNSGSAPFWRHGFRARFGRRLQEGDHTIIPCYDEIAAAVQEQVEQFRSFECEEIWELLLSDYEPWPPREHFYWESLELLGSLETADDGPGEYDPGEF